MSLQSKNIEQCIHLDGNLKAEFLFLVYYYFFVKTVSMKTIETQLNGFAFTFQMTYCSISFDCYQWGVRLSRRCGGISADKVMTDGVRHMQSLSSDS